MERLKLETGMLIMIVKMVNYFIYVGTFLFALYLFNPASDIAKVHARIENHFQMTVDEIGEVTDIDGVYFRCQ